MEDSAVVLALFGPLLVGLIFAGLGYVVIYYIAKSAINNSKLSQSVEYLRIELARVNEQLYALRTTDKQELSGAPRDPNV